MPLTLAPSQQDLSTIACPHCPGVILSQDALGRWGSRHDKRLWRVLAGEVVMDVDCMRFHRTTVKIDQEGVTILSP